MSQKELTLLKKELRDFDAKVKNMLGLPLAMKQWRKRKVKAIEKEEAKILHDYFETKFLLKDIESKKDSTV
jgi:hypothetical protein